MLMYVEKTETGFTYSAVITIMMKIPQNTKQKFMYKKIKSFLVNIDNPQWMATVQRAHWSKQFYFCWQ